MGYVLVVFYTVENMQEYGFSLTRILPYNDRMVDYVLIGKKVGPYKGEYE